MNRDLSVLSNEVRKLLIERGAASLEAETMLPLLDVLLSAQAQFAPESENSAAELADQLIENRPLLSLLKQQTEELEALRRLSLNLTSSLELSAVLDMVVAEVMRLIYKANDVNIFLYKDKRLSFGVAFDLDGTRNAPWAFPRSNGLTYTVARRGEVVVVENMREHPLYAAAPPYWSGSIIGIPLKFGDTVVGVMNLSRQITGGFSPAELRLLKLLSDQAAIAISNASLHQLISRQAHSDMLTGLPNRRALGARLEAEILSARQKNDSFAVIMMDLDGFKSINDAYGHLVGDRVLQIVFNRIARHTRQTDFLARYGGDELTLILTRSDISTAKTVAKKVSEIVDAIRYKLPNGRKLELGISGGIALYPIHGEAGSDLLRAADAALYYAKEHCQGTFQIAAMSD